jgi:RimJ/RimL family protein N-acetyltransferase
MKPYPTEWERHDVLRDGRRVFVRPLKPEDIAFYPDFLAHVTAEDMRLRFFAPVRELSPAVLERLIHLDYALAMAFIAFDEATGEMLGVVRLHRDPAHRSGEYAVLVRSALKGHGLGWLLMSRMIEYARSEGLMLIQGQVLAENTTMLTMCAELGFTVADDPTETGVMVVSLDLAPTAGAAG